LAEAYAMVTLIEQGWADRIEVARAFGRNERSVRRYQRRFEDGVGEGDPRAASSAGLAGGLRRGSAAADLGRS
jgi:hypothetical protein